jgi:hypothetical protein
MGGMHVLAAAIYVDYKQASSLTPEPHTQWSTRAVENGQLRGSNRQKRFSPPFHQSIATEGAKLTDIGGSMATSCKVAMRIRGRLDIVNYCYCTLVFFDSRPHPSMC